MTLALSKKAKLLATEGVEALGALRAACDRTEELVDHGSWPLPKYRGTLFLL